MRLVIPHTSRLRPEVAALGTDLGAEFYDLTGDDAAYVHLFDRLWAEGAAFINIEQDVLASPALLKALWDCPEELCSGYYLQGDTGDRVMYTLACVRFSAALIARLPNAMKNAAARSNGVKPYNMLDLALVNPSGELPTSGASTHVHEPAMQHLHDAPWPIVGAAVVDA